VHVACSLYTWWTVELTTAWLRALQHAASRCAATAAAAGADKHMTPVRLHVMRHATTATAAAADEHVTLFDAYLELFNGERGYVQLGDNTVK
jgi:predicted TPR repeat methyltransferase